MLKSPPSRTSLVGRNRRHDKVETSDRNDGDRNVLSEVEKNGGDDWGEGMNKLETILKPRTLKGEGQLEKDEIAFQESLELNGVKKDEQKEEVELRSLGKNYLVGHLTCTLSNCNSAFKHRH